MKDNYYGALSDTFKETDYQLAGGFTKLKPAEKTFKDNEIQYNQLEVSGVSCTLLAAIGAYSDLTGERIELSELKELWSEALELGAKEGWGWYINLAVDLVRKHFGGLNSFHVYVGSSEFFDALDKGYTIITGYRGNALYNADRKDGVLDKIQFGESTYGHAIRVVKCDEDTYELVVDNYAGVNEPNTYKIRKVDFEALIKTKVFFTSGFIFTIKETVEIIPSNVPIWAFKSYKKALEKGVITDKDDLNEIIMDGKMEKRYRKLGYLQKTEGNISLVRWLVIEDRKGTLD